MTSMAENYRRWLARRWFRDGRGGWCMCGGIGTDTKKAKTALNRWIRDGLVEANGSGLHRVTDSGFKALGFEEKTP